MMLIHCWSLYSEAPRFLKNPHSESSNHFASCKDQRRYLTCQFRYDENCYELRRLEMIEVSQLSKDYGDRRAIDSLSFKIQPGEVVGFLGPNGAGKSTTMKIITGFMAPSSGSAKIAGFDVFENPIEVKSRIGYLPETPPVYMDMFVDAYLRYVGKLKGLVGSQLNTQVDYALERTLLGPVRKRLIGNLSKGYRQRVGLAQALLGNPQVLILDEPTVGLDPKQVAEIRELIKDLRGQHTIILSTHILPEVEATCSRAIIIHKGKIVAQDEISNLVNQKGQGVVIRLNTRISLHSKTAEFMQVQGVKKVEPGTKSSELLIHAESRENISDAVAEFVLARSWGLEGLHKESKSLEDVFLSLTYGSES